jgi:RNA polymerase I-specific transcription initiation factor RRN3
MVSLASLDHLVSGGTILSPSTSIKRKAFTSDIDDFESSPLKRKRVEFNPTPKVYDLPDWNEKGLDLVREEVRRSLEAYAAGDSTGVDQIKQLFDTRPSAENAPTSALLAKYLVALMGQVSALKKNYASLVKVLLNNYWVLRDEAFVQLYIRFLGSLMSAQGGFIGFITNEITRNLMDLPHSSMAHSNDPVPTRSVMLSRTHECLKYFVRLIPTTSSALKEAINNNFPFETAKPDVHIKYTKNILKLTAYVPELRFTILSLITDRLIRTDVKMQEDLEDFEEDFEEDLLNESSTNKLNDMDDEEDYESDYDSESDMDEEEIEEKRRMEVKGAIKNLDVTLDLLFDYYDKILSMGTKQEMSDTFESLIIQFSSKILPMYRSRHTQFILFHFAQTSPQRVQDFVEACIKVAFDKNRPAIIGLAASSYLASFIARGSHVSRDTVRMATELIWCRLEELRHAYEPNCLGPDSRRYGSYYALAQALLYIFCFRWRDLIVDEDIEDEDICNGERDFTWYHGIKEVLFRNIHSRLNPLKVCSPTIVTQFARIAHHLRFMYIFSKLETNKRIRLGRAVPSLAMYGVQERETALSHKSGEGSFQLDAYFPFDPYRLPRSKRWVENDYNEWKAIPGLDEEKDDTDDSTNEEEGAEEIEENHEDASDFDLDSE